MQHTFFRRAKSIAGSVLIGIGAFILYDNLDRATLDLARLLGIPGNTFGMLPTAILAGLRLTQAYVSDHHRFMVGLFQHALATFWPLLLVIAGTALSGNDLPNHAGAIAKKDREIVDFTVRRSI